MSLILDALNRSRQDVGDIPGLDSQHQPGQDNSPGSNRGWLIALLLALAVIVFLLYERGDDSDPIAPSPQPVVSQPAIVPKQKAALPKKQAVMANKQQARPTLADTVPPATTTQQAKQSPGQAPAKKAPDAEVAALYAKKPAPVVAPATPEPRPAPNAKRLEQPAAPLPASVVAETVSEQPVDIEAMLSQAQGDLENARLEEHPAPFLSSLSQQTKDRIPTIFYERHDYSGKAGQSSVVLSGQTLKRGGRTSAGVHVDEILPDSVVLTHQGTQFRLRALNSWVNL